MYLKCIEINGFKSFANKILFEFPHGITGIVGPNGSGKSNIGDAVRWVLGEQSAKQLRGSKMEDVIFSGTQNRRPMGFAYVAITFENADRKIALDFDEVKVARRVYRSGESEYILNGTTCRRRDIVELFYDTGIGKEGYSIIGQGQVEKILSGKIEDSRELFDEAAGIAKYKKNRSVTEKSLEQERMNLERVTDTLNELEKRVGPLEKQSKKAKEYLRYRDREKELDLQLFLYDHTQMTKEAQELNRQHRIVSKDIEETSAVYDEIRNKNDSFAAQIEELSNSRDQAEKSLAGVRDEISRMEQEKLHILHEIESNDRMIDHFKELETTNTHDLDVKKTSVDIVNKNLALEEKNLKNSRAEEEKITEKLEILNGQKAAAEADIAAEENAISSLLSDSFDTKEKMGRYDAMEEQLSIRNGEYNSRLIAIESEQSEHEKNTESVLKRLEQVRYDHEYALGQYERLDQDLQDLNRQKNDLLSRMDMDNQEFIRARSRYETLSHVAENYDGYNHAIKFVMDRKKENPDIIGVVADVLSLDQKYETAIEIALGGALSNIVTENEQVAKKMIASLKKNHAGRATFLPLNSIRNRNITMNPDILDEIGVIGVASSLVSCDAKYSNLVKSLLGKTIVCDTIDHAILLNKKNHYSLRIVTIGGELLNPGGSMTGGALKHNNNFLGRKREIEESKETMQKAQVSFKKAKSSLESVNKEITEKTKEVAKAKQVCDRHQLLLHDLENQVPELNRKKKEIETEIRKLKSDHETLIEQMKSLENDKKELILAQEDAKKSQDINHSKIDVLNEKLSEINQKISTEETLLQEVKIKIVTTGQQMEFYRNDILRIESEMSSLTDGIVKEQAEQQALKQQNLLNIRKNGQIENALLKKNDLLKEQEGSFEQMKTKLREVNAEKDKIFHQLEEQGEKLRILEKDDSRIVTRLEKVNTDLESRQNYMWETYEITYNNALASVTSLASPAEIAGYREEKKEISQNIRQLGNVNVNAIEEYQEVGKRYEFLRGQYDDIKEAEEKLVGMIDELNSQMKAQFKEKFEEIRGAFMNVFKDLFEGGSADLELMDSANPLECGVRIIAQPPGKKLQNILLLSGGEKALTAIALLFAIQNLKPSPFCLLDEIEAALDDANIIRFSKYLRKLSRETQFIVITHRRGTMNASDALYGITMQEKGISTLISVDLIDTEIN